MEVEVVEGRYGELTVWVGAEKVVDAGALGFLGVLPSIRKIQAAVKEHAARRSPSPS
ncbi:MAG TPA: hypothetical protein VFO11_10670 [Candidatus Polarisedimenticolaceae bacterium]|nr:hypothetical protein [Candidatus Polarisedimenticolaceae bacterium]